MQNKRKILVLFDENYQVRRGSFNATLNRIKHLMSSDTFDIEVYSVLSYMTWLMCLLRHTKRNKNRDKVVFIDGVTINIKWIPYTLLDYILEVKLHRKPLIRNIYTRFLLKDIFKGCDLISAHSTLSGTIALNCHKKYGVPYTVTWHGSDIHTLPLTNKPAFLLTRDIIRNAAMNFFVSKNLMEQSNKISVSGAKTVLYNGVDKTVFHKYNSTERIKATRAVNVDTTIKNVCFVGNFIEVKNIKALPEIFQSIRNHFDGSVCFHFVGGGKYEQYLRSKCDEYSLESNFIINAVGELMPFIYNLMDLIVLPSLNEGLPLVAVESVACGTLLIGSRVGGIAEVVGEENTVPLGDGFVDRFSDLCVKRLKNPIELNLPSVFDWEKTAQKEVEIYNNILI